MNAPASIRPEVLGRLLVIPSILDVLSGIGTIALFLQSALREVPGISDLAIDVEGVCDPASLADAPAQADSPTPRRSIRLATNRQHYGDLILVIDDLDQF